MLAEHCQGRTPYVTRAATHLMMAGGKRFRPLLVLLAAETGPHPEAEEVLTAACVVELTHVASLYHDDVMDEADLRRGADTANARWDNHVAILTGDFLFGRSSELTADLGPDAVRIQARTFTRLVEGQILETVKPGAGRGPARALPRGRRRQDRLADRHLGALRRDVRRRAARGRRGAAAPTARSSARPSSSPTTSSTSPRSPTPRARRRAPTCARACRRSRS